MICKLTTSACPNHIAISEGENVVDGAFSKQREELSNICSSACMTPTSYRGLSFAIIVLQAKAEHVAGQILLVVAMIQLSMTIFGYPRKAEPHSNGI